jgi:DNA-directed RNA polymerase sigma subunit (sigma70/sigma32)
MRHNACPFCIPLISLETALHPTDFFVEHNQAPMKDRETASDEPNPANKVHVYRGSAHPCAILTEDAVRAIRTRWANRASTPVTQAQLGRQYKVSPRAIRAVLRREKWGHVE